MVGLEAQKHGCKGRLYRPSTLNSIQGHLRLILESPLGKMQVSRITENHLREYVDKIAAKTSGRTANLRLTELKKIFKLAVREGICWQNPTRHIELYGHVERTVRVPTLEEVQQVLADLRDASIVAGKRWNGRKIRERLLAADFIELLLHSGLRANEGAKLHWRIIDFERKILIRVVKGGEEKALDLFPGLENLLRQIKATGRSVNGYLFPQNERYYYYPRKALTTSCKDCDIKVFGFHGLRHRFASIAVDAGILFAVIAEWLGHKDGGILAAKRYGRHRRPEYLQAIAQSFHLIKPVSVAKSPEPVPPSAPNPKIPEAC
jgi:integrase